MRMFSPYTFFIALALSLALLTFPQRVILQTNCPVPFVPGYNNHALACWPESTTIKVIIHSNPSTDGFTSTQRNAIWQAFANWNGYNGISGNCSYVTFSQSSGEYICEVIKVGYLNGPAGLDETGANNGSFQTSTLIRINPIVIPGDSFLSQLTSAMAHEVGHTFGLGDCTDGSCPCQCTLMTYCNSLQNPTSADNNKVKDAGRFCLISDPSGGSGGDCYQAELDCLAFAGIWYTDRCWCDYYSPIIIDIQGDGYNLTTAAQGVDFDLDNNGTPEHLAWTSPGYDDAFLVLDRNGNGIVDNGTELFGNLTPQPPSPQRNGFLALAEYDSPANGGNGDGIIDSNDVVFSSLRLWQDTNHNGLSERNELHTLSSLAIYAIGLNYKYSRLTDQYGNVFRYRAKIYDVRGAHVGRWAYDVFLMNH
jgi:hypothetical protein